MAEKAQQDTPALEWIAGGLGALIFSAMLAVLIATGLNGRSDPPSVSAQIERVEAVDGGYVVEFIARNAGGVTAADIEIVAELQNGAQREERRARFDYLPPRSERRGGFFFDSDPRRGAISLHAEGYNDP